MSKETVQCVTCLKEVPKEEVYRERMGEYYCCPKCYLQLWDPEYKEDIPFELQ